MNVATEPQIAFINSLAARILAVDVSKLPTKAKAAVGFKYNPQVNARDAQAQAAEKLAQIAAGQLTKIGASNAIEALKVAARRAGL
ncbi:MAG: hypothetical protein B7X90_01865 [Novosphingobium sp. 17-62-19]|uniref:hypothetical protein n=1 Tax=Novosphingobium sp. 17-62-19 TaxID=1970406 RepID=UPI000BC97100|nr:hypothetical protein [Novosphingobium sp. 17-62-19]OZA21384.1 MAG: hypothetical protein B7X90_01865 [Novosphingobium sp. 17-62-19]HQS95071.1 hypothetical protein [Novosphingobium sp.]